MEEVKNCPNCGKQITDKFVYCPFCGAETEPKCKKCGEPLVAGANFCTVCGTPIAKRGGVEQPSSPKVEHAEHVQVRQVARPKKRTAVRVSKDGIIALVKSAFVVLVCILMFAFSFAGVVGIDVEKVLSSYIDTDEVYIEDGTINLNAVDFVKLMFATTRHYDEVKDVDKIEKLQNELTETIEDMGEIVEDDIRGSKLVLTSESKRAINRMLVGIMEYAYSIDSLDSISGFGVVTGDSIAEVCTAGALFFVNIFVTATLLAFAIVELVKTCKSVVKRENVRLVSTLDAFLPMLIALPLAGVFALSMTSAYIVLASELIAGLAFASIATLFVLALSMVRDVREHDSVKVIIPKIITVAMCAVVIGCCFAPMFKGTFEVQLYNESKEKEYSIEMYGDVFTGTLLSDAQKEPIEEALKDTRKWEYFSNNITTIENILQFHTEKNLYQADGAVIKAYSNSVNASSCLAQLGIVGGGALSAGYFLLVVAILLSGGCICCSISSDEKGQLLCSIFMLVVMLATLGISIAMTHIVDYHMETMESHLFKLELGGGCISAAVMCVIAIVFSAIPKRVWAISMIGDDLFLEEIPEESEETQDDEMIATC